ncbi:MAG: glutamate racemase [Leptospiraceae bacterium]|nr:glutamate racemase [Leptospiraceae bacterium]MCP5493786.1 glutamate racemase [Leptospiraceae bacterium]
MGNQKVLKLGVFDSGLGGISVLNELTQSLSQIEFVYYGDLKNAPYGEKTSAEVFALTASACEYLINKEVDAIVIACNTATSVAIEKLRARYSIPIFGMEPAIKPALLDHPLEMVAVMATSLTLKEDKFTNLKHRLNGHSRIKPVPCNGLAKLIDLGDREKIKAFLEPILDDLCRQNIQVVVLGCTHYVLIKELIYRLNPNIKIYDGNAGTARHVANKLNLQFRQEAYTPKIEIYLNGATEEDYFVLRQYTGLP